MNRSIRFVYKLLIGFLLSGCLNRMLLDMLARCRMVHSLLSSKLNYYNKYKVFKWIIQEQKNKSKCMYKEKSAPF